MPTLLGIVGGHYQAWADLEFLQTEASGLPTAMKSFTHALELFTFVGVVALACSQWESNR